MLPGQGCGPIWSLSTGKECILLGKHIRRPLEAADLHPIGSFWHGHTGSMYPVLHHFSKTMSLGLYCLQIRMCSSIMAFTILSHTWLSRSATSSRVGMPGG